MFTFGRCLVIGLPAHILYLFLVFSCEQLPVYRAFHFSGIPLTHIGLPKLNWFTIKPNADYGNTIFPSILFPVNADDIRDCLKYWRPYPIISRVVPWMVSSSYIYGCSV